MNQLITYSLFLLLNFLVVMGNKLARGFNEDIDWVNVEDGFNLAKEQKKPIMILIHKSWCGACKALKPKFTTDKKLEEFSKKFVMINIMDDEEPKDRMFTPDGGYIPRILFAHHDGTIYDSIKNERGNKQYQYFYSDTTHVLEAMQKALEKLDREEL